MRATKKSVVSNLIWRLLERAGAQGVTFVVSIILARVLEPEYFGQVALISVIINILLVFVDSGLGSALIQKPNTDDVDFSTVFFLNVIICSIMYFLLFLSAPMVARFYEDIAMTPMIRVAGLTLLIAGVKNIQQAYVSRNMMFKKFFYATLGGTLFSGVLGIVLAFLGVGAWAIICQQLSNTLIDTIILWLVVKWRPKRLFSWERFKTLFSFGWKLLASTLLHTAYLNLWQLIIGKYYTKADLAFYNRGLGIPRLVTTNINAAIGSVLFPALSSEQNNPKQVKNHVRRTIKTSLYLMWPILMGIGACAKPIIHLILTDKWLPCIPYLLIFCFVFGLMPIHTVHLQAINAMGRSDLFLKLEIIKKIIGIGVLLLLMRYGVLTIAVSLIFTESVSVFINSWPNRKLLNYGLREQIEDMLPSFLLSLFMFTAVLLVGNLHLPPLISLMLQIPFALVFYVGGSALLKFESYTYVLECFRTFSRKNRQIK